MGSTCIIARRLKNGQIQYVPSKDSGYFKTTGIGLLAWYNRPELMDDLFSPGKLKAVSKPHLGKNPADFLHTHNLTGIPHRLCSSEADIFKRVPAVDFVYFYDLNHTWYYITPGPFHIKFPAKLIANNLDNLNFEFHFIHKEVEQQLIYFIFYKYQNSDPKFLNYLSSRDIQTVQTAESILTSRFPVPEFYEKCRNIYDYFDKWVLVLTDEEKLHITGFRMMQCQRRHIETIDW